MIHVCMLIALLGLAAEFMVAIVLGGKTQNKIGYQFGAKYLYYSYVKPTEGGTLCTRPQLTYRRPELVGAWDGLSRDCAVTKSM